MLRAERGLQFTSSTLNFVFMTGKEEEEEEEEEKAAHIYIYIYVCVCVLGDLLNRYIS